MEQQAKLGNRVIVTGSRGFVGQNMVQYLLRRGYDVRGIDLKNGEDLKDQVFMERIFSKFKPDYVFHFAAITQVEDGLDNPKKCFENNMISTINICELARSHKFKLVHMSTDKVYGDGLNKVESSSLCPIYPYDVSKYCCEEIIQSYKNTYGINIVIARSCNIYGKNDPNERRIIPGILRAIKGEKLEIRSNGNLKRDYIYIGDLMKALKLIMDNRGIFNISSGENLSVIDILDIANKKFAGKIKYVILNTAENELAEQSLNFNKIKRLGFKPEYTLDRFLGELK